MLVEQALPLRHRLLEARDLYGADPRAKLAGLDTEPLCDPGERIVRRNGHAALDLAHVLLREPPGGELVLRQAGGSAQLTDPASDSRPAGVALLDSPSSHRDPPIACSRLSMEDPVAGAIASRCGSRPSVTERRSGGGGI